jgi:putative acetyltransferase
MMTQQIEVRGAQPSEFPAIREIMLAAFGPDETDLWDVVVARHPGFSPDGVRVALKEGRPVAATVVLPRRVRTPRGWAGGAVVTLVACHPDVQKQGYGGATVRDAVDWIARQGLTVGLLYGHPGYYPRFGFVPVLPHVETTLPAAAGDASVLVDATEADLPVLNGLYGQQVAIYSGAMARDDEGWWAWGARTPGTRRVALLNDRSGYAIFGRNTRENCLDVYEGAAQAPETARRLLAGLTAAAAEAGLPKLRLIMPFDHMLARTARVMIGAQQRFVSAAPGMAAIIRWDNLLPRGYSVTDEGLCWGGRLLLRADRGALTQLVMGYRSAAELCLLPAVSLTDPEDGAQLERDFPSGQPRWSLEPFWD